MDRGKDFRVRFYKNMDDYGIVVENKFDESNVT